MRANIVIKYLLLTIFSFSVIAVKSQEQLKLEDGDTVCFLGDSITQSGMYHMLFQAYYATRYPGTKVNFISCGIGGDQATHMMDRFEGDVLVHKPDYIFLMTGMNDMLSSLYQPNAKVTDALLEKRKANHEKYESLTTQLVKMIVDSGAKPILMTPSIYDETAEISQPALTGKNDALKIAAKHIRKLGKQFNIPVVDLNPFMLGVNLEAQKEDPSFTIVGKDRVHPQETGHFIMAHKIVNTVFPMISISEVVIDAEKHKVIQSENASVDLGSKGKKLSFRIKSNALPFPITERFQEAQQFISFQENNKELLSIKGLQKGKYVLAIDNKAVDTLSSKELQKGVNLAKNTLTPQYQQAQKVFELSEEYHGIQSKLRAIANVDFKRLKHYKGPDKMKYKKKYLEQLNEKYKGKPWYKNGLKLCKIYYEYKPIEKKVWKELDDTRDQIYISNIPKQHNYTLRTLNE